jgi:hypothetical protein
VSDEVTRQAACRAAAEYLEQLLLEPAYRQAWERYLFDRARNGTISALAVAQVLARHLWSAARTPADADVMPYQLADTVSSALSGVLTRSTLTLFIGAFGFTPAEEYRLWRLWNG